MATTFNSNVSQYSKFISDATDIYSQNKVNQYSKYLDSHPTFVTYYAVNEVMSRTDIGLGSVYDELGPNSPLRFNKITELPLYKIPLLQPQGNYEDGNYDVELDISDITALPNTITPKPYDFFCLALPNCKKMLFRVNSFRNNTIQSNDFYMFDADLRHSGDDCCDEIEKLVVERYHCVFENIGTQDNCFIRSDDENIASRIGDTIARLHEMYHDLFYDYSIGDYIFLKNYAPDWERPVLKCYYDIYLAKFINDSAVFGSNDNLSTSIVTYDDREPFNFEYNFKHTLWYAVMTRDTNLLVRYPYYYTPPISKMHSPIIYRVDGKCFGFSLVLDSKTKQTRNGISEYFPHKLISLLLDGKTTDNDTSNISSVDFSVVNLGKIISNPDATTFIPGDESKPYVLKDKNNPSNDNASSEEDNGYSYVYDIVYNYMSGITPTIDCDKLVSIVYHHTLWSYHMIPLIIFVLKSVYSGYFKKLI